jgi:hypothetical protein
MWLTACAQGLEGLLLFVNTFGWLFEPRDRTNPIAGLRVLPFITWPCQDRALRATHEAITAGHDLLLDKSRDMGATWLAMYTLLWFWWAEGGSASLVISRKEELVDKAGSPDALFWKLDFATGHLPDWILDRGDIERTHLHLGNRSNGSSIDGESTNKNVGRASRRKVAVFDEYASVDNAKEVLAATADTTPCRFFVSTPKGAGEFDDSGELRGNAFAALRFSGKIDVVTLHWREHPIKGRGLYTTEAGKLKVLDEKHPFPADYGFILDGKLRSPWYDEECRRRASRVEIAQEIDIDYLSSGSMFFDSDVLARHRNSPQIREPYLRGELSYRVDTVEEGVAYHVEPGGFQDNAGRRRLALYCHLVDGRLSQEYNYAAFCDISAGVGASNSTFRLVNVNTRDEILTWTCPNTPPQDFARYAVAICKWTRGACGFTYLGWESTGGQGKVFGIEVHRLGYAYVLGNYDPTIPWNPRDNHIGWDSNRTKKYTLLGELRTALARNEYITHDIKLIEECERYVYYESGGVGPSELTEEKEGARAAHGDRTVAAAGCVLMMKEQPKARPQDIPVHPHSMRGRQLAREARKAEAANRW